MKHLPTLIVATALLLSGPLPSAQRGAVDGEWREYGGDTGGTKYSPLNQINRDNIRSLRVVWRWPSPDRDIQLANPALRSTRAEETPLMVGGVLYTVTPLGMVAALEPDSGKTLWLYDPEVYKAGRPTNSGFIHRGLGYWTDGKVKRLLHGTNDAYLISIDADTGKPDPKFGYGGRADLTTGIRDVVRASNFAGRRPLVAGDVIVVGNSIQDSMRTKEMPPGYVKAFDVRTGKLLWTFHTVPRPGEFGVDTWLNDSAEYSGNTNVWGGMTYDAELDYVYMPISGATNNVYGGQRLGNNLFAESLVCVEAKTGKRVWHFQAVHHGIWDYDLTAQPVLGDVTVNGRRIKAVMQVSKQAFTYVFDRRTGEPVWPIEERRVAQSTVAGEQTAPTQPFPTKPPGYDLQGAVEENLIDFTPELRQQAIKRLQMFEYGPMFTPPSEKGTVTLPGTVGGSNWGGAAFDPETGMLYVPSQMTPSVFRVYPNENLRFDRSPSGPATEAMKRLPSPDNLWIDGLSIFKPPYSRVTAIDMNRGEFQWMKPLGNGPRNHPLLKGLNVPPLGDDIERTTVMATKTLVFVGVQRLNAAGRYTARRGDEWSDPDMNRKIVFVFDKNTGEQVHALELDGLSASAPMTYLFRNKQYIVVATGAGEDTELVALSLP